MSVDPVARLANLVMSAKAEYGPHILFPAPLDNVRQTRRKIFNACQICPSIVSPMACRLMRLTIVRLGAKDSLLAEALSLLALTEFGQQKS